ncbi:hypothetical protein Tco_0863873 [Tanacetum coccineum]
MDRCMRYDLKWDCITRAAVSRREVGCGKWWWVRRRRVVSRAEMRWMKEVTVRCDEVVVARKLFEEMCMVICEDRTDLGYDLGGDNVFV